MILLKDVDSGKVSVQTTKENEAEMKEHELNCGKRLLYVRKKRATVIGIGGWSSKQL
jgi:hypothetical protein